MLGDIFNFENMVAALALAIFFAVFMLTRFVNIKNDRVYQFFMPYFAFTYSFAAIFVYEKLYAFVKAIFYVLPISLPPAIVVLTVMALIVILWQFVKLLLLRLSKKNIRKINSELHYRPLDRFLTLHYDYDKDADKYYLSDEFSQAKNYVWGLFSAAKILFSIIFFALLPTEEANMIIFIFPILILGEIYFYFQGETKEESGKSLRAEDDNFSKKIFFDKLPDFIKKYFGKEIAHSDEDGNLAYGFLNEGQPYVFGKKGESEFLASAYYRKLRSEKIALDKTNVKVSIDLDKGINTILLNPFYRDFGLYLLFPLIRKLLNGDKVLVMAETAKVAGDLKRFIEKKLSEYTGGFPFWRTEVFSGKASFEIDDVDILIVEYSDLYESEFYGRGDFIAKIGFAVLVEPSRSIAVNQVGLDILSARLELLGAFPVYLVFDKSSDNLVDTLSHVLKRSFKSIVRAEKPTNNFSVDYHKLEKEAANSIFPDIARYLGVGIELSAVAYKVDLGKVHWFGGNNFPVLDMKWVMGMYSKEMSDFMGKELTASFLDDFLDANPNIFDMDKTKDAFIILEDVYNNPFELAKIFRGRGENSVYLSVLSRNHILYDYMVANARIANADSKALGALSAEYVRSERNVALKLIWLLAYQKLPLCFIREKLSLAGTDMETGDEDAQTFLANLFNERLRLGLTNKDLFVEGGYVSLRNREVGKKIEDLKLAHFISEDEDGGSHKIGSRLFGHVCQDYILGQEIVYDGLYYEIENIRDSGHIILRRAADKITNRFVYRNLKKIKISDIKESKEAGAVTETDEYVLTKHHANINVGTLGYLRQVDLGDFSNAKKVIVSNIPERRYFCKEFLEIEFTNATPRVLATMAILINEIFRVLYPSNYNFINVAIDEKSLSGIESEKGEAVNDLLLTVSMGDKKEYANSIFIVEDSNLDIGLLYSAQRNLERIFGMAYDYLDWLENGNVKKSADKKNKNLAGEILQRAKKILAKKEDDKEKKETAKKGGNKVAIGKINPIKKMFRRRGNKLVPIDEKDIAIKDIAIKEVEKNEPAPERPQGLRVPYAKTGWEILSENDHGSLNGGSDVS